MAETTSETGRLLGATTLDNGETVVIAPLSPYALNGIIQRSKELYPDPDPKLYERPIKGAPEGAPPEPLDMNPDWVTAKEAASKKQMDYTYRAVAEIAVAGIAGETREQTIERYAPMLKKVNRFVVSPSDTWGATVLYCIITTKLDTIKIFAAANQVPTVPGVNAAIRFFRVRGRGAGLGGSDRKETPSGLEKAHDHH